MCTTEKAKKQTSKMVTFEKNANGKYPVTFKHEVTFELDKQPTVEQLKDMTEGMPGLMFRTAREISRRYKVLDTPKDPGSFVTLRSALMDLHRLANQFPMLIDKPLVFIDKTTNEHHTFAWQKCSVSGFTEFTPKNWGMCSAVIVEEVHRNWELPKSEKPATIVVKKGKKK